MSLAKGVSCGTLDKAQAAREDLYDSTAYAGFDAAKQSAPNYFLCDGTADDVQINLAEAYVTALGGGSVVFERGTYDIADPIIPTGDFVWYKGQGDGTVLDGDALATTEHIFHITAMDNIRISDMSMLTEDGAGKTCHCIFIEDGSNHFLIENVTIWDSDSDGIHVEGTTMTDGHIHNCRILDVDDNGIQFAADNANYMYYLKVTACELTGAGERGIRFADGNAHYEYCVIQDNTIHENTLDGIYGYDLEYSTIGGNALFDNDNHGIILNSGGRNTVVNNVIMRSGFHGIYFVNQGYSVIDGNTILLSDYAVTNTYDGVNIAAGNNYITVSNNQLEDNRRYGIYTGAPNTIIEGNGIALSQEHGIIITAADCICNNNAVNDNSQRTAATYHGIYVENPGDSPTIVGNQIDGYGDAQEDGIHLGDGVTNALINSNYCNDGMGSGIALTANNVSCSIVGNYLMNNDDYGIEITAASCTNNLVKENYFVGNVTGAFLDSGVQTELATLILPFIAGGDIDGTAVWASYVSATASAKGWSVSGAADWAQALGQLPQELKQIVRVKIWAVALGTPIGGGGQMHLEINMNAGAENLAYTTEAVALANFDSETTDYVANDVVLWVVDSSDDTDIGDMAPGMSLEVEAIYEDGSDPDGATNAVFRAVEVEYV